MGDFKIKFRGVRGSFPVADKDFMNFGGNTSCVEINAGGNLIILDAGTGIVKTGDELIQKHILSSINPDERTPIKAVILLSHIHQDHLLGLTFFKPMHLKSTEIEIFGSGNEEDNLAQNLSNLVFGKTFPLELSDICCNLNINNISDDYVIIAKPDQKPVLVKKELAAADENDVLISFYKSYVHPKNGVMVYKISYKGKSVVYATDKECYMGGDKKFVNFAKNCDILIHDTQYTTEDYLNPNSPKQGYGHSTYDMAVEVMKQTNARTLVCYHYDPNYNDEKLSRIKEHYCSNNPNIIFSYEGLEMDLG